MNNVEYRLGQLEARVEALTEQQRVLHADVRKLMETHALMRGAIKTLAVISAAVSTVVSFLVGLFR